MNGKFRKIPMVIAAVALALWLGGLGAQIAGGPRVAEAAKPGTYDCKSLYKFMTDCKKAGGVYVEGNDTVGCYRPDGSKTVCENDAKNCTDYLKPTTVSTDTHGSVGGSATLGSLDGTGKPATADPAGAGTVLVARDTEAPGAATP